MSFHTTDPFTGQPLASYEYTTDSEIRSRVQRSWKAFENWREIPVEERAKVLKRWAQSLRSQKTEMAKQFAREMGKPITDGEAEIEKSAFTLDYLAQHGPAWLEGKSVDLDGRKGQIVYRPTGPVLAVMPWNFPLWQLVRFAGPALLAGNTIVMKHSTITAGSAEMMSQSLEPLSLHLPLLQNVFMTHQQTEKVIGWPEIRGITFTGSTRGGREIARSAAAAMKKSVLELGGSDAYLILEDADLQKAAKTCAAARLVNGGQSCVAAKRFIVVKSVVQSFLGAFVAEMKAYQPGNPLDRETKLGPMASRKFQKDLFDQVNHLKQIGGEVLLGGDLPAGEAAFFPPTVVFFQKAQAELGNIEIFGPVAIVVAVDDQAQALHVANDSVYGLGSAVFTSDPARAQHVADRLEAGLVAINDFVRSDVRLSFGGVKESGWGRELSPHGILEFCNIQSRAWGS